MLDELLTLLRQIVARLITSGYTAVAQLNRAANTTQYTANDVVGTLLTFSGMGPVGRDVLITSAELEMDISAVPGTATMTTMTLHLYSQPPGLLADNAAWDLVAADRGFYLGSILFPTPVDLGSTLYIQVDAANVQRKLVDSNLYGYLVTTIGYTPAANSEVYRLTLHTVAL